MDRYLIERSVDGGPWAEVASIVDLEQTSWQDPGPFEDGVEYRYRVRLERDGEVSEWSNVAGVVYDVEPPVEEVLAVRGAVAVSVEDVLARALVEEVLVQSRMRSTLEEVFTHFPVHVEESLEVGLPIAVDVEAYFMILPTDLRALQVDETIGIGEVG